MTTEADVLNLRRAETYFQSLYTALQAVIQAFRDSDRAPEFAVRTANLHAAYGNLLAAANVALSNIEDRGASESRVQALRHQLALAEAEFSNAVGKEE